MNHIHAMGARGSSPLRFFSSKTPDFKEVDNESYKKEKMDKAQGICRKLDTIKRNHMLKLNTSVLESLNNVLPQRAEIKFKSYQEYPLASPCLLGNNVIFKKFKEDNQALMNRYNAVLENLIEIDTAKQTILKADKKEQMDTLENEFVNNLDVSNYFNHTAGLNSQITVTQEISDMSNDMAQRFRQIPLIANGINKLV